MLGVSTSTVASSASCGLSTGCEFRVFPARNSWRSSIDRSAEKPVIFKHILRHLWWIPMKLRETAVVPMTISQITSYFGQVLFEKAPSQVFHHYGSERHWNTTSVLGKLPKKQTNNLLGWAKLKWATLQCLPIGGQVDMSFQGKFTTVINV